MLGQTIAHYKISELLGEGGMGQVYRARDTRLKRDVAIKVLPARVAQDADRLRRFEQEALATAALNHPNILVVYDIGREADTTFVVEELLEGRTLREVIDGGEVPLRKAVDYAAQIAQGLSAAHGKGIVHRDLKPENLFVTADDHLKILDFGLAKVVEESPSSGATSTVMAPGTEPGMVLGTIGYMSPEQVRGLAVDHRADIFSFGAVLYELLTGNRAFRRETAADTMTAILKEEPPELSESGRRVPVGLLRVVQRCLEKQPAARFQSASDLAFALQELGSDSQSGSRVATAATELPSARSLPASLTMIAALLLGVVLGAALWTMLRPVAQSREMLTLDMVAPPGQTLAEGFSQLIALSPDGTRLAMTPADAQGQTHLWIRTLSSGETEKIADTVEAVHPFWSPDGASLGFYAEDRLKVADLVRGRTRVICSTSGTRTHGTWNRDDVIVFASDLSVPLMKVKADGRTPPTPIGDVVGFRPFFLPDARHVLTSFRGRGLFAVDIESGQTTSLRPDGFEPKVAGGYLLFGLDDQLMAQPFDAATLTLSGEPRVVVDIGDQNGNTGPNFDVAGDRLVAFVRDQERRSELVWYTREGVRTPIGESGDWQNPQLSPDDTLVAVRQSEQGADDIWLYDVARGQARRLSEGGGVPIWSPDGTEIWFYQDTRSSELRDLQGREESGESVLTAADPVDGRVKQVLPRPRFFLTGRAADGTLIGFNVQEGSRDIRYLKAGEREVRSFAQTPANETQPALSPDGRWIAYVSDAGSSGALLGDRHVVVDAFPGGGRRKIVSGESPGVQPVWRKDGRELLYLGADRRLMAISVEPEADDIRLGAPRPLFQIKSLPSPGLGRRSHFDVTRDGLGFIVIEPVEEQVGSDPTITLLVDWMSQLDAQR